VIEAYATELEVVVQRVVSPLDTGSIHGRGQGLLRGDRGVELTFLIDHSDFVSLRQRMLGGAGEVRFRVSLGDVTAIDAAGGGSASWPPPGQGGAGPPFRNLPSL
jgi:hypothetical protein